jgi:hypothetical protein
MNLAHYCVFLLQIKEAGFFIGIGPVRRVGEDFGNKYKKRPHFSKERWGL